LTTETQENNQAQELTINHLASDIRQLAFEMNNMALTVSALIEMLGIDKQKLAEEAKKIFNAALEEKAEKAQDDSTPESIMQGGEAKHPEGAAIFSAT